MWRINHRIIIFIDISSFIQKILLDTRLVYDFNYPDSEYLYFRYAVSPQTPIKQ